MILPLIFRLYSEDSSGLQGIFTMGHLEKPSKNGDMIQGLGLGILYMEWLRFKNWYPGILVSGGNGKYGEVKQLATEHPKKLNQQKVRGSETKNCDMNFRTDYIEPTLIYVNLIGI